jgi:hypothetical protein
MAANPSVFVEGEKGRRGTASAFLSLLLSSEKAGESSFAVAGIDSSEQSCIGNTRAGSPGLQEPQRFARADSSLTWFRPRTQARRRTAQLYAVDTPCRVCVMRTRILSLNKRFRGKYPRFIPYESHRLPACTVFSLTGVESYGVLCFRRSSVIQAWSQKPQCQNNKRLTLFQRKGPTVSGRCVRTWASLIRRDFRFVVWREIPQGGKRTMNERLRP